MKEEKGDRDGKREWREKGKEEWREEGRNEQRNILFAMSVTKIILVEMTVDMGEL